jgi:hypothetical protein
LSLYSLTHSLTQSIFSSLFPLNYFDIASWREAENRREYFKLFAKENFFDPNVPYNWYRFAEQVMEQQVRREREGGERERERER